MRHLAHWRLARCYVELHNAASREYKAVFKSGGARMWNGDNCHVLRQENEEFIRKQMHEYKSLETVRKVYGLLARPLTVCDSYPHANRRLIDRGVDLVHKKFQRRWEAVLKQEEE